MSTLVPRMQSLLPGGSNYTAGNVVNPGAPGALKYTPITYPQPTTTASDTQTTELSGQYNPNGSGSGSGSRASGSSSGVTDPAATLQYDLGIKQGNDALGRVDTQLSTALANLDAQYNSAYNRLLGTQSQADRNYNTNHTQQLQDYQDARSNVADNSRNLLLGARRLIGAAGAGGGSADRFAAPNAAQIEGNANNAVIQKTNSRNLGALDTAYDDNKRQLQNSFTDLSSQLEAGQRNTRSQFEQQRANILNSIAQLTGKKSIAQGQTLAQAQAAAAPFTDRVTSILNTIDQLAANPAVLREQAVNLAQPNLEQYQWNRFSAPAIARQDPSLAPALAVLTGYNQDDRQPLI